MEELSTKSIFVTLVGCPNSGKSSLINSITGENFNLVSAAPNSTRNVVQTVYRTNNCEIVFFDTPGLPLSTSTNKIDSLLIARTLKAIKQADFLVFLVAGNEKFPSLSGDVLKMILSHPKYKMALITKYDLIKDPKILQEKVFQLREMGFTLVMSCTIHKRIFIENFLQEILKQAPISPWLFSCNSRTEESNIFFLKEKIREVIFQNVFQEIPYLITVKIFSFQEKELFFEATAVIFVHKETHMRVLIGKQGSMIRIIRKQVVRQAKQYFKKPVTLFLKVKLAKKWTKNKAIIKQLV